MWRDTSATQVHQSLNTYQHYPMGQGANSNNKWSMMSGQRSSYSLPHPGHSQSNMRWQEPPRHLSNSTRNLSTIPNHNPNPSFLHPVNDGRYQMNGARQRPASMYDTPNMPPIMAYHHQQQQYQNGFLPPPASRKGGNQQQRNNPSGLRQSPGELVSLLAPTNRISSFSVETWRRDSTR